MPEPAREQHRDQPRGQRFSSCSRYQSSPPDRACYGSKRWRTGLAGRSTRASSQAAASKNKRIGRTGLRIPPSPTMPSSHHLLHWKTNARWNAAIPESWSLGEDEVELPQHVDYLHLHIFTFTLFNALKTINQSEDVYHRRRFPSSVSGAERPDLHFRVCEILLEFDAFV